MGSAEIRLIGHGCYGAHGLVVKRVPNSSYNDNDSTKTMTTTLR